MNDANILQNNPVKTNPNWWWLLVFGIILIIMGLIGLGMVTAITIVSMIFFGVLLIISGIANFFYVFRDNKWQGVVWHIVGAFLYIGAGILILYDPVLASAIITAILGGVFIIIGISRLILAASFKPISGWGWLIFAGIVGILLGIVIFAQWPISALWFIGLFISVELIVTGWSYLLLAITVRK